MSDWAAKKFGKKWKALAAVVGAIVVLLGLILIAGGGSLPT